MSERKEVIDHRLDAASQILLHLKHHENCEVQPIEKPLRCKDMRDVCCDSWDAEFIDSIAKNPTLLFEVILGSCDVSTILFDLCCAKVASLIKGKTLDNILIILQSFVPETHLEKFTQDIKNAQFNEISHIYLTYLRSLLKIVFASAPSAVDGIIKFL